jgi:peptide/nickel transport system ATP-binding protein
VIGDPQHPYTRLLIDSIPWPDMDRPWGTARSAEEDAAMLAEVAAARQTVFRGEVPGVRLETGAA